MDTLEALSKRIATTEDLEAIVATMKSLSAVSIRAYERAVEALVAYRRTIDEGLQVLLQREGAAAVRPEPAGGRTLAVVFGSDHGLCGRFNQELARFVAEDLQRRGLAPSEVVHIVAGLRVASRLDARGVTIERILTLPGSVEGLTETAQSLLVAIDAARRERGVGRVLVHHNRRGDGTTAEPHVTQLLPLDPARLEDLASTAWPSRRLPTFTLPPAALLSALVRQHLFIGLFQAAAESAASEHATRLTAMQAAERNIEEHLDEMNAAYRQRRQAVITEELLDVVAGFEALTAES